jgi:hypothetical protein
VQAKNYAKPKQHLLYVLLFFKAFRKSCFALWVRSSVCHIFCVRHGLSARQAIVVLQTASLISLHFCHASPGNVPLIRISRSQFTACLLFGSPAGRSGFGQKAVIFVDYIFACLSPLCSCLRGINQGIDFLFRHASHRVCIRPRYALCRYIIFSAHSLRASMPHPLSQLASAAR